MLIPKDSNKKDFIIQLFCMVDDLMKGLHQLPGKKKGRPACMCSSEVVTCMLFGIFTGFKTIRDLHWDLMSYHNDLFTIPCYKNFLAGVHAYGRDALMLLCAIIQMNRRFSGGRKKFIDATPVAVCNNKRIFDHKVAQGFAARGKSTMGRFFGFKVHIIVDDAGNLLSFSITPGNCDDRKVVKKMVRKLTGILIADAGYVSSKLISDLHDMGITFLTGYKQNMKKLVTHGYLKFLKLRQIVETGFGMMKCGGTLVSSYARSIGGHFSRIIYNLLAYAIKRMAYNQSLSIS